MKTKKAFAKAKENAIFITAVLSLFIVLTLWFGSAIYFKGWALEDRGTFGDMYGAVNALFSGLAFTGLIITILLQRKDLNLQRDEMELTRKEFVTQNDTLKRQQFENTFFNLLSIHHQIVDSIDIGNPNVESFKGRDVFRKKYDEFRLSYDKNRSDFDESLYMRHYEQVQTDFGHYFRNLYRMVKMVDEADLIDNSNPKESLKRIYRIRYKYTSIIRSNLSDYELLWIFYNSLSKNGKERFQPLIVQYTLLKNLPIDKLIHKKHKDLIGIQAFEKNIEKLDIC